MATGEHYPYLPQVSITIYFVKFDMPDITNVFTQKLIHMFGFLYF